MVRSSDLRTGLSVACLLLVLAAASAAQDAADKRDQGKLSSALHRIAVTAERGGSVKALGLRNVSPEGDRVKAVIELAPEADVEGLRAQVVALGGSVEERAGSLVRVSLPPLALRAVSRHPAVRRMREPYYPSKKDVVSEGAAVMHAPEYRSRTGADGTGVAVAILDSTFAGAQALVGSELPAGTIATDFVSSRLAQYSEPHGTACAEIVHDVAPGATLVLAGFEDEVGWAAEIDRLVAAGVRIISHSIGFDNLFPLDGNNFFTQKVDQVAASNVLFVTAAGNEAEKYYQGTWRDLNGNRLMEFGANDALAVGVSSTGTSVVLRWDDPFGRSSHDYDLLIVTEDFNFASPSFTGTGVLAYSADAQRGASDPTESLQVSVPADRVAYAVVVWDSTTPLNTSQRFWLWASDGVDPSLATASYSLSTPGDARGALTVGAVAFDSGAIESFSSRGPTADGRIKPDLAGPDRVTTAGYAGSPFPGTSAATPHVAGAAALILSRYPGLSAASLRAAVERATTSGGGSKNNDVGYGLVDLNRAQ